MRYLLRILIACAILFGGVMAYSHFTETWTAFVYPSRTDRTVSKTLGPFRSIFECRDQASAELTRLGVSQTAGTYACGKNCDDGSRLHGVRICKEMAD